MSVRAAVINLRCGGDISANLAQAEALIRAAHQDGAQFISTPENTLVMTENTKALFAAITPEEQTIGLPFFSALAKELAIDLHIGSMAIKVEDGKAANRTYLFGPDGQIKARYDKIHMFDVTINATETWKESANYRAGQNPVITKVGDFNLGLSICYDLRFAGLYRALAQAGAEILLVPAAFSPVTGAAHWEPLLRARAIENGAFVVASAQTGKHDDGRETYGHSMVVDPWGRVLCNMRKSVGIRQVTLDISKVADARAMIEVADAYDINIPAHENDAYVAKVRSMIDEWETGLQQEVKGIMTDGD